MHLFKYSLSVLAVALSLGVYAHKVYADGSSELILQENASGFCGVDGSIDDNHSGFTGSGFANTDDGVGKGITWRVHSEYGGYYQVKWRYANDSWGRTDLVSVNGTAQGTVPFNSTGSFDSWAFGLEYLYLPSGESEITLTADVYYDGVPNIDYMIIYGDDLSPVDCVLD